MAYVTPLYGGSDAQIDYRLGLVQHGCDSDASLGYHTDARERALMWIGEGLDAFGVDGVSAGAELTEAQFEMARRLIRGQHIGTGDQLVTPKVAVPADAKLSLGPLVAAVTEAAAARGVDPATLFDGVVVSKAWATAARGVERRGGRAMARSDEASVLAEAAGLDPDAVWGGEQVREAMSNLHVPRPVYDKAGEPVLRADGSPKMEAVERRERVGIAGYDIGITLPKSMSVLLAMAPDELTGRIEGVYTAAAARTFSWTETRTSYVKRGHHGGGKSARHERSSGMSGWVMTHRTARPVGDAPIGDPHWHVHITVANMAKSTEDGEWLTIAAGGRELMRHAPAIDKVTQADVRAQLHRELGITFARSETTGLWEVEHIRAEALGLFSKRHQQVVDRLGELGYTNATASAKDARVLTRDCRSGKGETTSAADVTLREYWRAQAIAAGYDPAGWMPAVLANYRAGAGAATTRANETMLARHGITLDDVVARLTDPEHGLTAHSRRFSHLEAITATADALPHGASAAEVEQLTDLALAHPAFIALPERDATVAGLGERAQLAGSHEMTGGQLFTTRDIPAAEQTILDLVLASHTGQRAAVVAPSTLGMAINVTEAGAGYTLSGEQCGVLETICIGGRAVESLEGPAGTGKTTVMRAARAAWEAQGMVVAGAATAAVAAQGLQAESGIASLTCEQWRVRIRDGRGLSGVDVLVLDESTLTDDRDRLALYTEMARAGVSKIVEIHDPKQHRSPGCGSSASYIHAVLDGPALTENRRQRNEDERAALALHRGGRYLEALSTYDRLGEVVATHTADEGVSKMVATWLACAQGAPDPHTRTAGLVIVAATNAQIERINEAVQAVRVAQGQLGDGASFALPGGRQVEFHVGDHVLIRTNDRRGQRGSGEGVLNGYRGVVTGVSPAGVEVAWRQAGDVPGQAPHTSTRGPSYIAAGGLELGYAITTHKCQGLTVRGEWARPDGTHNEGTVLAWGPGLDAAGQLVGLSRDVGQVIIFGGLDDVETEQDRLTLGVARTEAEVSGRLLAAMAAHAEATATCADDRPTVVDVGLARTLEDHRAQHAHLADAAERERQAEHTPDRAEPATETAAETDTAVEQDTELGGGREPGHAVGDPAAVQVTDAQRVRWNELNDRVSDAMLAEDTAAEQATQELLDAYSDDLGPERTAALEREDQQRFDAQVTRCDAEERAEVRGDGWDDLLADAAHAQRDDAEDTQHAAPADKRLDTTTPAAIAAAGTELDEAVAGEVTDAQRVRWNELHERGCDAWLAGDAAAEHAVDAEVLAYSAELGPERTAALRREEWARFAGQEHETGRPGRVGWEAEGDALVPPVAAPEERAVVEAVGAVAPVEYSFDEQWCELNERLREAQLRGGRDALRVTFEERWAYESERLDPDGRDLARRETWERYAARVVVTDEHRQRYAELGQQRLQALRDSDPDARAGAEAATAAFRAEIGPDRLGRLQREATDRVAQRAERYRVEQRWMGRPHSKLTDAQLAHAVNDAAASREVSLAAAEKLRATIAANEAAVAAGQGPQVGRVDAYLAQVRRDAELTEAAHHAHTQYNDALSTADMAARQAAGKRVEAQQAPWYRSGLRERLLADAAQLDTRAQHAAAAAEGHGRQLDELTDGGVQPGRWYDNDVRRTQQQLQRARDSYERDRAQSHDVDLAELAGQRSRLTRHGGDADTAAERRAALTDEQQQRVDMPAEQATTESGLRLSWLAEQRRIAAERAEQQQREYQERSRNHYYDRVAEQSQNLDRGFGLGR